MLAASDAFDGGGDSLVAFVHIVWRDSGDRTTRLIHTDGDGLAVIEGDGQRIGDVGHRCAVLIHKAGGVDDIAAFADGGSGGQDHIDFVDGVVDRGGGAVACNFQFFEVTASGLGDLNGLAALIDKHVIGRGGHGHSANSVASLDGDRRTVVEFQRYVSARFVGKRGGVRDLPTFVCLGRSGQRHSSGVVGTRCVRNDGVHRGSARHQVLEMLAAGYAFDGGGDSLVALVHVIRSKNRNATARLIHTNGDGLAIVQGYGQRVGDVSHRCAVFIHKAGGVDDVAAFANGGSGGQDHIDFVDGVVDRGRCAIACNFQFFEVAASSLSDLDGLGALVDEHVIGRCGHGHGANSFASLDGNRRAVVQLQRDVSASFVGQRGGVRNLPTLVCFGRSRQRHGGGVVGTGGIGDSGVHCRSTRHQIFKVLAAGHAFDGGSDGLVAFVDIVWRDGGDRTARLVYANSDGLAVIQGDGQRVGDVGHRCAVLIHKAGGVDDVAAFANGGGRGQDYIDLVDGVVDRRGCTITGNFEFFEVAADGFGDLDGLGALVDEHVIGRRRHGYGANSFSSFDGDRRAVIQLQGDVGTGLIAQGRGIGDLAPLIRFGRSCQRYGSGVIGARCVRNGGVHRGSARDQILEMLAAGHTLDSGGDGLIAFIDIIRSQNRNATASLVYADGDGLAVIQGDGQRVGDVGHRRTVFIHKAGGVDDVAAFANGGGRGQDYIDLVDGVVDRGRCAAACDFQFFEVAASGFGDLDGLGALIDEHVIGRCRHSYGADGFAGFDGDRRAVIQLQRDVGAGLVAQGRGVGDLATLIRFRRSCQRYGSGVIGAWCISNGGVHRGSARDQILEMLAAGHTLDSGGDGLIAFIDIIRSQNRNATASLVYADGDGLAVIQGDGQRVGDVGHRRTVFIHKAGGVDDVAAFANGGGRGQDYIDLVDGVVDRGRCAAACDFQFFEVAASGFGDLDGLGALIDEHVIGRCRHSYGADGFAGFDGDRRAVIQLQRDVSTGLIAQGRRIGDLATLIRFGRCCQRYGSGVIGAWCISNDGVHRGSARHQVLEMLAAGYAFDSGGDGLIAFIDIIRSKNRNATASLVYANGDGLAVIQGDGQRVGDVSHRRTVFIHKASGVDDVAAFTNGGGGRQDHIDLVDGVVDRGGCAVACYFEFFEVAAGSVGDLDGLSALIDEHVIARSGHGHSANRVASLDGNRRAVVQLQRDVSARFIGKRGGVRNLSTLIRFGRSGQGHGSGVVGTGCIGNGRVNRGSTWNQIFKMLAAGHAFDGGSDGLVAFVHIVWRYGGNGTARLVYADGDGLAVIEGDGQRIGDVSHWYAVLIHKAGGVNDVAAFADGGSGGQDHINFVDRVVDRGGRTVARNFEFFEIAASGFGDLDGLSALIDKHVIGRGRHGYGANSVASLDRDRRAVIQLQGDVSTGLVAQGRGVRNLTTFARLGWSRQRHGSGVIGTRCISHSCGDVIGTWDQIFKVFAAGYAFDSSSDGLVALIHIIRSQNRNATARLVYANGDGLAVIQGDGQRVGDVSHRRTVFIHKASGVDDVAAFANSVGGRQNHIDFVDGVVDGGGCAAVCHFEFFEVAAGGFGDLDSLGALVDEHVIGRRRHGYGANGFASFDSDRRAVIQLQDDVGTGLVAQGRGVGDLTTFVRLGRSGQCHGSGVIGAWCISNGGVNRGSARDQIFEVLATSDTFDGGGDGLVALIHIIRSQNRNATARLVYANSDGLAVIQSHGQRIGDVGHRCAVFIHKAGGVNDIAAFANSVGGRQNHINFVDRVVDRGGRTVARNFEFFEVAADGFGDLDGLGALVDEHVIGRRRHGYGANSFSSLDGDRRAVIQLQGDVGTGLIAQGRGVGDLTTFARFGRSGQCHRSGVIGAWCIRNGGINRGSTRNQVLEMLAAGHTLDSSSDGLIAFINIVWRHGSNGAAGLVNTDGNGLTVIQSHGQRVGDVSHRRAVLIHKASGVDDIAAFTNGRSCRQHHINFVEGVVDRGGCAIACNFQFLEVAARGLSDLDGLRAFVDEHIIARRRDSYGANGLASLDGDRRTVIQLQRDICASFVGKRGGIRNLPTFVRLDWRCQRHSGGVDRIGNGGNRWRGARHQALEIAASRTRNRRTDGAAVDVDVISRRINDNAACRFAGLDGDHRAIAQGDVHRRLRRVGQRGGIGDLAAFSHGRTCGQGDRGGIDRIGNGRDRRRGIRYQILEVTARCTGDRGADGRAIVVDVVSWRINHNATRRLTGLDGDHRAIAQGDVHRGLRRVGQGGGVGDLAAFGHGRTCGQSDRGGVDRIGNGGDRRRGIRYQILEVTARCARDRGADRRTVVVDIVSRRINDNSACRLTSLDGDHRAIAQGDVHRGLRWIGQGGGVGDLAAFGHGRTSGQGDRGGVDGVGDLRHGRVRVDGQYQVAAAGGTGNADADLARVDVRAVIGGQGHIDGAGQLARRDSNHRAIGQGDGQVTGGWPGHGSGVGQHAARFGDGRRRAQG
ncbi:hypothetical protein PS887_01144 [Pseudomonas fluorescens]|nr:hypothetical protein PS887_01144 [Pseudomonas fluorescens]